MRDIPIIFSAGMVNALLGGHKTETRRLAYRLSKDGCSRYATPWQAVQRGDRFWVREHVRQDADCLARWRYAADGTMIEAPRTAHRAGAMVAWAHHQERTSVPSIHMPRFISRLTLVVRSVHVEPLQAITVAGAKREGVRRLGRRDYVAGVGEKGTGGTDALACFSGLWMGLHGIASWHENPEVVVLRFKVRAVNIDAMAAAA